MLVVLRIRSHATTMPSVVTKSAEALGKSGKPPPPEIWGGEARCFPPYCTRDTRDEGAQNMNQFANWTNFAAGIHSTTYVQHRSFVCSHK